MWASKIGYGAAASRGAPRTSRAAASETSGPRAVIAGILSRGPSRDAGRPARPTRAVADALRVGDRGEDHAVRLGDTSLVRAAAPADDPRRRAADERRRRALEREQARRHPAAERLVSPRPVAPDHPVARDDHRHGVRAERVAHGARGPRPADAACELRVGLRLAERNPPRLGEHAGLEGRDVREVHVHGEERATAREVLAELLERLRGVPARARRHGRHAAPEKKPRDATVGRLDPEAVGERLESGRPVREPRYEATHETGGRDGVREEVPQCRIHSVHPFGSSSAFRRIALPRLSWLFTVLMEIPRTLASSRYERPFT